MARNFHEQFEAEAPPMPSERSTGLVFAGVAAIAAVIWRADTAWMSGALAAGALFTLAALATPRVLGTLNVLWFRLALALNRIISPVIMGVLYAVVIVPAGLIMQRRHDPLFKRKPDGASYWIDRQAGPSSSDMRRQF